jgi:uncharacterized protein CbrC (UPF0167 family)
MESKDELLVKESEEYVENDETEVSMVLKLKKPYAFEGKEYEQIDLTGVCNLCAADMLAAERHMRRVNGFSDATVERSLGYSLLLASKAMKVPIEFFNALPTEVAYWIKDRVLYFLLRSK